MWNYIVLVPRVLLAIPPVFVFLGALRFLDSYGLVGPRRVPDGILYGIAAASVCYVLDTAVFLVFPTQGGWDWRGIIAAPVIEEFCKAGWVVWLIRRAHVAFTVDAAICGFAAGAGFALVENIYYLHVFTGSSLVVWTLRGFGTAIMHGGTAAIVGVVCVRAPDRHAWQRPARLASGFALAVAIHAAWNMALLTPLEASVTVMLVLPVLFVALFIQSEKSLHRWMGEKLDHDLDLMGALAAEEFPDTRIGNYLRSLQASFPPAVFDDMLRLLSLSVELSGGAKGNLIRRAAGLPPGMDPAARLKMARLKDLEARIGLAARRALAPLRSRSTRDLWELNQLGYSG